MSALKQSPSFLTQPQVPRINWERIESEDDARAVLIQTYSLGGNSEDAADFLSKLGHVVSVDKLYGRITAKKGKAHYVEFLKRSPLPEDIKEKHRKEIRSQLLERDHVRSRVWCFETTTRAAAVALLNKGEIAGNVARVVSLMLEMKPEIEDETMIKLIERGGGRAEFAARLLNGVPPFTDKLTEDQLKQGGEDAAYYLPIALSRLRERAEWMKRDDTRAFVLSLVADENVSLYMIEWALRKKFKIELGFSGLWDRIRHEKGDTLMEKRRNFAESRSVGLDDPDLNKRMHDLALDVQNEYIEHIRKQGLKRSALGNKEKKRRRDKGREAFDTVEDVPRLRQELRDFEKRVFGFESDLRSFALSLTKGDKDRSDDLVQETLIKALRSESQLEDRNLKAWLFTILRNTFFSEEKSPNKKRVVRGEAAEVAHLTAEARSNLDASVTLNETWANMEKLPPDQRKALELVAMRGYSVKAAAAEMGVQPGTIQSRVFRARAMLKALQENDEEMIDRLWREAENGDENGHNDGEDENGDGEEGSGGITPIR